jgi:hypothetical protein
MKNAFVWLPLAFVIGGIVGYYGPAEELRAREAQVKEQAVQKAKKGSRGGFASFASMVNIPESASRAGASHERKEAVPTSDPDAADIKESGTNRADRASAPRMQRRRTDPEDLRARIDEAADLWRTRSEIARASAVEKLRLDAAGENAFNAALKAMNDKLRDSIQIVADEIAASEEMTPELGVRMMGDLSASLAEAYDAVAACADEGVRNEVSRLNLVDFIDPSVAEPMIAVQGKLEAAEE